MSIHSDAPSSQERRSASRTLAAPYSSSLSRREGSAQCSKVALDAAELALADGSDALVGAPADGGGSRKFNGSCSALGALADKGGALCSSDFLKRVNASLRARSLIDGGKPPGCDEEEEGGSPSGNSGTAIHSIPCGFGAASSSAPGAST